MKSSAVSRVEGFKLSGFRASAKLGDVYGLLKS